MNTSQLLKMGHLCQIIFDSYAVTVDEIEEATTFEARLAEIGKPENQRPFDASLHILPKHRVSAIVLQHAGRDIGGVIARQLDLGSRPVADLLDDEAVVLYQNDRPHKLTSPTSFEMRGSVAYLGEGFIKENTDAEAWRGKPGLAAAMVRYAQVHSFSRWQCDWVYGIIKQSEIEGRGRVTQYGFSVVEPNLQSWAGVDDNRRDSTEYLVANSRAQFSHIANACAQNPVAYFPGFAEVVQKAKHIATSGALEPSSLALSGNR